MSQKEQDGRHHDPLNTPLSDVQDPAPGQGTHIEGMGGKPPARGERFTSSKLPAEDA